MSTSSSSSTIALMKADERIWMKKRDGGRKGVGSMDDARGAQVGLHQARPAIWMISLILWKLRLPPARCPDSGLQKAALVSFNIHSSMWSAGDLRDFGYSFLSRSGWFLVVVVVVGSGSNGSYGSSSADCGSRGFVR